MELDEDPDILDCLGEEASAAAEKPSTSRSASVFLGEHAKLEEFFRLFPPVCPVRGCGHRMEVKRIADLHFTAVLHLICSEGHGCVWQSAVKRVGKPVS